MFTAASLRWGPHVPASPPSRFTRLAHLDTKQRPAIDLSDPQLGLATTNSPVTQRDATLVHPAPPTPLAAATDPLLSPVGTVPLPERRTFGGRWREALLGGLRDRRAAALHAHQPSGRPELNAREQLERLVQLANAQPLADTGLAQVIDRIKSLDAAARLTHALSGQDAAQAIARLAARAFSVADLGAEPIDAVVARHRLLPLLDALHDLAARDRCTWAECAVAMAHMAGHLGRQPHTHAELLTALAHQLLNTLDQAPMSTALTDGQRWACRIAILRAIPTAPVLDRVISSLGDHDQPHRLIDCVQAVRLPMTPERLRQGAVALARARRDPAEAVHPEFEPFLRFAGCMGGFNESALRTALVAGFGPKGAGEPPAVRIQQVIELAALATQPLTSDTVITMTRAAMPAYVPGDPTALGIRAAAIRTFLNALVTHASLTGRPAFTQQALMALRARQVELPRRVIVASLIHPAAQLSSDLRKDLHKLLGERPAAERARSYVQIAQAFHANRFFGAGLASDGLLSPAQVTELIDELAKAPPDTVPDRASWMVELMQLSQRKTTQAQLQHTLNRLALLPELTSERDAKGRPTPDRFCQHAAQAHSLAVTYICRADARAQAQADAQAQGLSVPPHRLAPLPLAWAATTSLSQMIAVAWKSPL